MKTTQIEWYSKQEAGERLGTPQRPLSPRRVLELAKAGKIVSDRFHDPKTGQMIVKINAGSLERYLDERGVRQSAPDLTAQTSQKTADPSTWTAADGITKRVSELVQLTKLLREREPVPNDEPPSGRLWLTLGEAEDYTGLPATILLRMIQAGVLPTIDVGIRRGGRWRVRRVDLDRIEGRLICAVSLATASES